MDNNHNKHLEHIEESVLRIPKVVYDEIRFVRHGFKNENTSDVKLELQSKIDKIEDGHYRVSLRATVEKEDEYEAVVQISGFCEVDEHSNEKDTLLEQNSVAILFAYVRSELTLITAQPETDPIVLPVVNIASMMQKRKM